MEKNIATLVDELFADIDVQRLIQLSAKTQPLQICFPKEVNVTRFLAWLLDPSQGHGLADLALRSLLTRAGLAAHSNKEIPLATRRFLAPSNVYSTGFSGAVVSTEVNVGKETKKSLDLFCIDQGAPLYVALENKFGAKESDGQLEKYREGLEVIFPSMMGVHIFLDSNEEEPNDPQWIKVGYDWLAEFLRESERRETTAPNVVRALAQFRAVIEEEDEEAASSPVEKLTTFVASKHAAALKQMKAVAKAKGAMPQTLAQLIAGSKGKRKAEGEALLRLFLLYCRRPEIWQQCFGLVNFAPFLDGLRAEFPELLVDMKRVKTYLSLPVWERFIEKGDDGRWNYPLVVSVALKNDKYTITTYCWFSHVRADIREKLLAAARALRSGNLAENGLEAPNYLAIKRIPDLAKPAAVKEAIAQMRVLQEAFRSIESTRSLGS